MKLKISAPLNLINLSLFDTSGWSDLFVSDHLRIANKQYLPASNTFYVLTFNFG